MIEIVEEAVNVAYPAVSRAVHEASRCGKGETAKSCLRIGFQALVDAGYEINPPSVT